MYHDSPCKLKHCDCFYNGGICCKCAWKMSREELHQTLTNRSKKELITLCKKLDLPLTGSKDNLRYRIVEHTIGADLNHNAIRKN